MGRDRFPERYPATVLEATAVYRVLQDIDGVPAGSVVTPPICAPPPIAPHDSAAAQGNDSADASSLIVAVTRPAPPLRARAEQLTACPSFTAVHGPDSSTVTATVLPAPPVDADDSYAVEQTVTAESGSVRRTLTLVAQIGEVQLSATWMQDGAPDTGRRTASRWTPCSPMRCCKVRRARLVHPQSRIHPQAAPSWRL